MTTYDLQFWTPGVTTVLCNATSYMHFVYQTLLQVCVHMYLAIKSGPQCLHSHTCAPSVQFVKKSILKTISHIILDKWVSSGQWMPGQINSDQHWPTQWWTGSSSSYVCNISTIFNCTSTGNFSQYRVILLFARIVSNYAFADPQIFQHIFSHL